MANTYTISNLTNTGTITSSGSSSWTGSGITLNTGAVSGATLTSVSNGGTTYTTAWANPSTNFSSSNGSTIMTIPYGEDKIVLEDKATLEVQGNIVMNGMDLDERLKTIEKVLCIPQRDVTMEAKHPKLKQLYEQYMHELEKYKTWERVKGE